MKWANANGLVEHDADHSKTVLHIKNHSKAVIQLNLVKLASPVPAQAVLTYCYASERIMACCAQIKQAVIAFGYASNLNLTQTQ